MYDISRIRKYILYLKRTYNLHISIHTCSDNYVMSDASLEIFNIHDNSYCVYLKKHSEIHNHCVKKQFEVQNKCTFGEFCGVCHAGVKEYIYPVNFKSEVIGFISVGGYQAENGYSYVNKTAKKYNLNPDILTEKYKSLNTEIPEKSTIDSLIFPLCDMIELANYQTKIKSDEDANLAEKIIGYIDKYYARPITSEDICKHFSCSRSYMSLQFNTYTGKSIREYINETRIRNAKSLLRYSNINVSEVAFSVGFSDSNYFSVIFKKQTSMSPTEYRKRRKSRS